MNVFEGFGRMSLQFGKLISSLLLEHYGEAAQKVGFDLFRWGAKSLPEIVHTTGLPIEKVKSTLCLLIQFNFVTFGPGKVPSRAEYSFFAERVLLLLRYPRYLYLMKSLYGDEDEALIEELLQYGQKTASETLFSVAKKLNEAMEGNKSCVNLVTLRDKFKVLATNRFIQRCPSAIQSSIPNYVITEKDLYYVPEIDLKELTARLQTKNNSEVNQPSDDVYWRVNFDRFHQEMRDQILISAIARRVDENGSDLMNDLLKLMYIRSDPWAPMSNPIPFTEIRDIVRKKSNQQMLFQYLDQYLKVIEEDSCGFVEKSGDSGGGQFSINMKKAFTNLAWVTVENIVMERFGSKAARIFRLVKMKKYIEQDQVIQLCMIPSKECKLLIYQLSQENFLQLRELRKSLSNSAPNKTFYLYHIDLEQVVRMVLEMSYKALYNALVRRESQKSENKRLIEKQQRIESIALNLKEQGAAEEQLAEIEDMLTPPERTVLEKVRETMGKLTEAELQIEETVFVFQLYIMYKLDKQ